METTKITIQGIQRNKALNEFPDGAMQEIINLRFRDGAWRPIPGKQQITTNYLNYQKMWLHVGDNLRNYIAYDGTNLCIVDVGVGLETVIAPYTTVKDVKFIKRLMVVIGDTTDTYLWTGTEYEGIELSVPPYVYIGIGGSKTVETDRSERNMDLAVESFVGNYREKVYDNAAEGYITGHLAYRFAWKLFDGSFVNHSIPNIFVPNVVDYTVKRQGYSGTNDDAYYISNLYMYKLKAFLPAMNSEVYNGLSPDIFQSLCIFAGPPTEKYRIDEEGITYEKLQDVPLNSVGTTISALEIPISDGYETLPDPENWHLIHEIPLEKLQNLTEDYDVVIDTKNYMTGYGVLQTLPVDSFSHHKISGNVGFVYNDRLILGDTTTIFGRPGLRNLYNGGVLAASTGFDTSGYVLYASRIGYLCAVLKTDSGELRSYRAMTFHIYSKGGKYYIFIGTTWPGLLPLYLSNLVIGYQDARAVRMEIYVDNLVGGHVLFGAKKLEKSKYGNYAYFVSEDYDTIIFESASLSGAEVYIDDANTTATDENRVQVSELRNTLVYPARNSYQVGTGRIIAFGANTEPISTGQYGEHPLFVFTTKGIWSMMQGQGDVIFAALSQATGDVALSADQVISVGRGVVFSAIRGLSIISGQSVDSVSDVLEGAPLLDFQENKHLQKFTNDPQLCTLLDRLSIIDFLDYLPGAKVGFDKINNELVISNENQDYSYVFNFESMSWHKYSDSYQLFINDYPELIGINQNGAFNLSVESQDTVAHTCFITQPQSISLPDIYKKIERSVLRCTVSVPVSTYLTFAIWASNDLKTWQFITGGQRTNDVRNILTTRSHGSAKYYIFGVFAQLKLYQEGLRVNNSLQAIDITIAPRLEKKLRS